MSTMSLFDTASWGGFGHGSVLGRLQTINRPRTAPPDLSRATNLLLDGTHRLATQAESSVPVAIEQAKSAASSRTQIQRIDEVQTRMLRQLRLVRSMPPVGTEQVWQDMPRGRGLYLVEQPSYLNLPANLRQAMIGLGYERPASASLSGYGFGALPATPEPLEWSANDDELIRRLQAQADEASGGMKFVWLPLVIAAGATIVAVVGIKALDHIMTVRAESRQLEAMTSDEVGRRTYNTRVLTNYEAGFSACLKQKQERRESVTACTAFLAPTEIQGNLEGNINAWREFTLRSAGICGWASCAKWAGISAALGVLFGALAAAKYSRSIPKIEV